MLALEANRTVTADRLIEGLWGEHPPASAAKMVQNHVWRLRSALGADGDAEILTRGRGYELRIDPDRVDIRCFERLLDAASRVADDGGPADGARRALALWRGPALADVADEPFAAAEIRRLEELRVDAAVLAIAADVAAGRHQAITAEVETLIAAHPLRERLHALRMLALYRSGRQADALEAYRDARRVLVDEIGVEPGRQLQSLHRAILAQTPPSTWTPSRASCRASPTRRHRDRRPAVTRSPLNAHSRRASPGSGSLVTARSPREPEPATLDQEPSLDVASPAGRAHMRPGCRPGPSSAGSRSSTSCSPASTLPSRVEAASS